MNARSAVFRLIYNDASWYFVKLLLLFITVPLTIVWIIAGLVFDLDRETLAAISGPAYFFFAGFGLSGFKSLFPISIGMGSTREQFLKAYYGVGIGGVIFSVLCLNICQYALVTIYQWNSVEAGILHAARLFLEEYHFFAYLWIDLMVGMACFGLSFFGYAIVYRVGFFRSVIMFMIVTVAGIFLYYGGTISALFDWMPNFKMSAMAIASCVGAVSLAALFATYPMLRHAPLHPMPRKG
ncbi:hypothetical protein [Paenibacillus spongiae]|uniref:DUF4052 domain-containing protein n=1 Tax=Paenibacillus spongiae TaxID=2909671 RepID=A0ABY5SMN3_9BACL|nr:hypothetical protein [Paenibacillus spongiae]UVI33478.1 hypothetical protein L1F29_17260 [Paenibacillus spongiae]